MTIVIEAGVSLIICLVGFILAYNYLHKNKWYSFGKGMFSVTRNKSLYFAAGLLLSVFFILLLSLVYHRVALLQIKLIILVLMILPCAVVDYKEHKIPNSIIIAALAFRFCIFVAEFVVSMDESFKVAKDSLIGLGVIGGFFLILYFVFKNSIGMGDVKLFAVIGIYQGLWGSVNSVFYSLIASFCVSVFLLITKKKKKKDVIAFGPSILLGTIVAISFAGR